MSLMTLSDSLPLGIFSVQCGLQLYLSGSKCSVSKNSFCSTSSVHFHIIFKDSRSSLCSTPSFNMPVFKPFTVTPGANWPLLGEGTDLSVFVEIHLPDLPGVQQLEKKSEQMSVLQTINNNQQMLQALGDQMHMAGQSPCSGIRSWYKPVPVSSDWKPFGSRVPEAAHQVYFSLRIPKQQLLWEGRIRVSVLWGKFAWLNNLFGVRKRSYYRS